MIATATPTGSAARVNVEMVFRMPCAVTDRLGRASTGWSTAWDTARIAAPASSHFQLLTAFTGSAAPAYDLRHDERQPERRQERGEDRGRGRVPPGRMLEERRRAVSAEPGPVPGDGDDHGGIGADQVAAH